jgi:hypothetical protein
MKKPSYMICLVLATTLTVCKDPVEPIPIPPATSEQLAVSVQTRARIAGERVPVIRVSGGAGTVAFMVTRADVCAPQVTAGLSRGAQDLTVVATVSQTLDSLCDPFPSVVEYAGTITAVSSGSYRVRVFDARDPNTPTLIGSAVVSVSAPAP